MAGLPLPVAKPVAYLLVRRIVDPKSEQTRLRTKLGCGIVNNESVSRITEKHKWRICGIIGQFDTLEQARGFLKRWHGGPGTPARRGPVMRLAKGMALAEVFALTCWFDFTRLLGKPLVGFGVRIFNNTLIAYDLTQALELVNA